MTNVIILTSPSKHIQNEVRSVVVCFLKVYWMRKCAVHISEINVITLTFKHSKSYLCKLIICELTRTLSG